MYPGILQKQRGWVQVGKAASKTDTVMGYLLLVHLV
jgi:hypothetical protein